MSYTNTNDYYYNILNIPNTAYQDEIIKAYKKLSVKYDPSKNPEFNDKFIQITLAFEKLIKEDIIYTDKDNKNVKNISKNYKYTSFLFFIFFCFIFIMFKNFFNSFYMFFHLFFRNTSCFKPNI